MINGHGALNFHIDPLPLWFGMAPSDMPYLPHRCKSVNGQYLLGTIEQPQAVSLAVLAVKQKAGLVRTGFVIGQVQLSPIIERNRFHSFQSLALLRKIMVRAKCAVFVKPTLHAAPSAFFLLLWAECGGSPVRITATSGFGAFRNCFRVLTEAV